MPAIELPTWTIVDIDFTKAWARVNMENTPEDDLLALLIASATVAIERAIFWEVIDRGLRVERFNIETLKTGELWTLNPPILGVKKVIQDVNRVFGTASEIALTEFIIDNRRGKISYVGAGGSTPIWFATGLEVVQVEYWGGYRDRDEVPWDLRGYCLETVANTYYHITRKQFATSAISDDQGNRTFMKSAVIPTHVKEQLDRDFKTKRLTRQVVNAVSTDSGEPAPAAP